jgi:hypothetical protein
MKCSLWQDVSSLAENTTSLYQMSVFQHGFQHLPLTYLYLPDRRAEYPLRSSILTSSLVRGDGRSCEMAPHMSNPSIPVSFDTSPPADTTENGQLYVISAFTPTQVARSCSARRVIHAFTGVRRSAARSLYSHGVRGLHL